MPDPVLDKLERLERLMLEIRDELRAAADDTLLTAEEAGRYLNITPRAIRLAAWRNALPAVRVGRRLRFRRKDLKIYGGL